MINESVAHYGRDVAFTVTMLRMPRAHVLSQYLMCTFSAPWVSDFDRPPFLVGSPTKPTARFGEWVAHFADPGWRPFADLPFPQSLYAPEWQPLDSETRLQGARLWVHNVTGEAVRARPFASLRAALASRRNAFNDWQCYNPVDHQTRALAESCKWLEARARAGDGEVGRAHTRVCQFAGRLTPPPQSPHHMHQGSTFVRPYAGGGEAELAGALRTIDERLNLTGVTELYTLTLCLLLHGVRAPVVPEHCFDGSRKLNLRPHITHGTPRHALADVDAAVWDAVDGITALDARLYAAAKARLIARFHAFNAALPLGGRRLGEHLLVEKQPA